MDIDTCITIYLDMAPKIFPRVDFISRSRLGKLWNGVKGKARFDAENLERMIKNMVSKAFGSDGEYVLLQSDLSGRDPPQCRT